MKARSELFEQKEFLLDYNPKRSDPHIAVNDFSKSAGHKNIIESRRAPESAAYERLTNSYLSTVRNTKICTVMIKKMKPRDTKTLYPKLTHNLDFN